MQLVSPVRPGPFSHAVFAPTDAENLWFRKETDKGELAAKAAGLAREFYTRFPKHPKAADAKEKELALLKVAAQLDNAKVLSRLEALELAAANDSAKTDRERLDARWQILQKHLMTRRSKDAFFDEYENGLRELQKDFPKEPKVYRMFLDCTRDYLKRYGLENCQGDKAAALAKEVLDCAELEDLRQRPKRSFNSSRHWRRFGHG